MRLKQKHFVPFMIIGAILTMIVIVFSSFHFKDKQQKLFRTSLAESDSLMSMNLNFVGKDGSVQVASFRGNKTVVVFWASWSEKSDAMLKELQEIQQENKSFAVLSALVKDAEESLPEEKMYPDFTYVDGTQLYNHLKVPGIPSYILLDAKGDVLHTQVGYKESTGIDSLRIYLQ